MTYLITIAPDQEIYYPNSMALASALYSTFPPNEEVDIVMVRIVDRPPYLYCSQKPEGGSIEQPCLNLPQPIIYRVKDSDCNICVVTKAKWIPAQECRGEATLLFTEID